MNLAFKSSGRILLSLTRSELVTLSNSLNEVCNGINITEAEFETRVGASRSEGLELLARIIAAIDAPHTEVEVARAWADSGAVMVKAISAFGDPVELGEEDVRRFAEDLASAIREAL